MKTSITKKIVIISIWIAIWAGAAFIIDNDIVLAGPLAIIKSLVDNIFTRDFLIIALNSSLRIILGFMVSLIMGILLGALSFRFELLRDFLSPFINVLKVIPVASFVVLLLIWAGAENLSFFISLLIVFPHIYIATLSGAKATDHKLLSMARDYDYSIWVRMVFIYRDYVMPYIISAVRVSFGMAWKSGVAAEVIGMSAHSLGERIYMSKIYLDTAGLFSWTLIVVLLSYGFEKICLYLLEKIYEFRPSVNVKKERAVPFAHIDDDSDMIELSDINVSFGDEEVLKNISVHLKSNGRYLLCGESGIGKTTLINEIAKRSGLKVNWAYQDLRLLERYDAITNIALSAGVSREECIALCKEVLPKEALGKKISELSGGMKQRVAILRALLANGELLLMDEPFSGLDDENKQRVIKLINEMADKRILIIVSHDLRDENLIKAQRMVLDKHGLIYLE